ncbi:hypothetical protein ANRL3_01853 [Anaerolineae bacterium]|nr:hypothetical protein ANRL3_01853 [Anaerolineae bacterium]
MTTKNAQSPTVLAVLDPEAIPLPAKILVLFGRASELYPLVLQFLFLRAQRDERLGLIVGDNHLNEYELARLARAHAFDPQTILAQIEFSRPFTCHQLHHCVVDLMPEKTNRWRALYILGLLDTFYDEDIRLPIVLQLLGDILTQLRFIASQGLPVLITLSPPPSETPRVELIARVIRATDALARPPGAALRRVNDVPAWRPSSVALEHAERTTQQIRFW